MIKDIFSGKQQYDALTEGFNLLSFSTPDNYGLSFNNDLYIPKDINITKESTYSNLDFAVSDFKAFLETLKWASLTGRIQPSSKYHISKVAPNKSYVDAKQLYLNRVTLLSYIFAQPLKTPILSFKQYFTEFTSFIALYVPEFSFVTHFWSKQVSIYSSGLAFSISKETGANMDVAREYILDSDFYRFQRLCLKHNFIIDRYRPWVIVRRLSTSDIEQNIAKYDNVYAQDIDMLYSSIKSTYLNYVENILDKKHKENADIINLSIDKTDLITAYLQIKLKEKNIKTTNEQFNRLRLFFIMNCKSNSVKDSVIKFDRLTTRSIDSLFNNREPLLLR